MCLLARESWPKPVSEMAAANWLIAGVSVALMTCPGVIRAQDLEPRAYANTPVGMNFAILGYGYTEGDVLTDAAIPIRDAQLTSHTTLLAYARAFDWWGDSAKIDVVVPYAWTSGSAHGFGEDRSRDVHGFGDPALRFTWNFIGAPAMSLAELRQRPSDWIVGGSFRVGLPLGQYDEEKLLNIGANRWSFKPELGVSKTWRNWTFEMAAGVTVYTDNDEFLGALTREQEPILSVQGHVIYSFPNGIWAGLDGTFYTGGQSTLNGTINDDRQSNSRVGLTFAVPLNFQHSLKLYASTGASARVGGDFDTVGILWQYRWGGMKPGAAPAP